MWKVIAIQAKGRCEGDLVCIARDARGMAGNDSEHQGSVLVIGLASLWPRFPPGLSPEVPNSSKLKSSETGLRRRLDDRSFASFVVSGFVKACPTAFLVLAAARTRVGRVVTI